MTLIVYFDRNVFADICELRNDLTPKDVSLIKDAIANGRIKIPLSGTVVEETVNILRESETKFKAHIEIMLTLVDKSVRVLAHDELLLADCYAYAQNQYVEYLVPSPANLLEYFDASRNKEELLELAEEVIENNKRRSTDMTLELGEWRQALEEQGVARPKDFQEVWDASSHALLRAYLKHVPRNIRRLCKKYGLDGMLEMRSFRIHVLYHVWFIYSGIFGVHKEPRKVREGDQGDHAHAVQASVADIFVTQESKLKAGKLPYILNLIPIPGFKVMNLREFLQFISS